MTSDSLSLFEANNAPAPMVARVLLDGKIDLEFDYLIPPEWLAKVKAGVRVRVNLRGRRSLGVVLEVLEGDGEMRGLRALDAVVEEDALFTAPLMDLAQWIATYYYCALATVLRAMVPQTVRRGDNQHMMRLQVSLAREVTPEELDALEKKAPRQSAVLRFLAENGPTMLVDLLAELRGAENAVKILRAKEWIKAEEIAVARDPMADEIYVATQNHDLSDEQQAAVDALTAAMQAPPADLKPFLLHGITGSGKTEVYLRAMERCFELGKSVLVLVPEISLTPQTAERFKSRFAHCQERIAILHSGLSAGERHDEWQKLRKLDHGVAIGPRSAIFSPLANLGLIIVDEEHDGSYKQESVPRYHGRDAAVVRAKMEGAVIVLGSATPSLESWHNVQRGKYSLLKLTRRVDGRSLPLMRIIDMRQQANKRGATAEEALLSPRLRAAITDRLEKQEQTILFLNRRGFASSMTCLDCGHTVKCDHCSVSMTYHRTEEKLICHICGFRRLPPRQCPECKDPGIRYAGYGTQKIEAAVAKLFPSARVARVDGDTMGKKNVLRDILREFRARKIDIIIGTQIIAKGLDFPHVTLVGVLNADLSLHLPDFRAGERTFQLLTQVAGRAGRGEMEGEVFVQTVTPHHSSVQFARHHDYEGFATQELETRQTYDYPPFSHLILLGTRSTHEDRAEFTLQNLHHRMKASKPSSGVHLGDPLPSPLQKAEGQFRFLLTLRSQRVQGLMAWLRQQLEPMTFDTEVNVTVDVDAQQLN